MIKPNHLTNISKRINEIFLERNDRCEKNSREMRLKLDGIIGHKLLQQMKGGGKLKLSVISPVTSSTSLSVSFPVHQPLYDAPILPIEEEEESHFDGHSRNPRNVRVEERTFENVVIQGLSLRLNASSPSPSHTCSSSASLTDSSFSLHLNLNSNSSMSVRLLHEKHLGLWDML
ncbi:unnamed protein product [Vicia faba]|uniref:Uncharacterized protein n=1 Tax=Vicia faba TaxID=3906 RepID=A0AAV0Z4B4_VICFA|nr:unnamed protein product [Vicia faba]